MQLTDWMSARTSLLYLNELSLPPAVYSLLIFLLYSHHTTNICFKWHTFIFIKDFCIISSVHIILYATFLSSIKKNIQILSIKNTDLLQKLIDKYDYFMVFKNNSYSYYYLLIIPLKLRYILSAPCWSLYKFLNIHCATFLALFSDKDFCFFWR